MNHPVWPWDKETHTVLSRKTINTVRNTSLGQVQDLRNIFRVPAGIEQVRYLISGFDIVCNRAFACRVPGVVDDLEHRPRAEIDKFHNLPRGP